LAGPCDVGHARRIGAAGWTGGRPMQPGGEGGAIALVWLGSE
jgi:hypothetical protein